MKSVSSQATPAGVPKSAKQAGDIRARWAWTEETVWTDRMLAALENGVKGGVWFSLIDKVVRPDNLHSAFSKVKANRGAAGVDHQTIAMFERDLNKNVERLAETLGQDRYGPQSIRRVYIPKPGSQEKRPLGIPTVRDRVVQTALRQVIEPIFERDFAEHSYGFRPGRGSKDALRRVDTLLKEGYGYVVDADLRQYFDTIPHERLMMMVREKIADSRVLKLIESFLTQGVLEGLKTWQPTAGSPQGAVISPLLANLYLNPLDHRMADVGYQMVRYADDFVILCRTADEAQAALADVQAWVAAAGLTLHPTKTQIVEFDERQGFDFLGYHFRRDWDNPQRTRRWPRRKSVKRLRETLRQKTPRKNGSSLLVIIGNVNRTLRGWFEYFKHISSRRILETIDGYVRRRLRRILLKRHKHRHGSGRGQAHRRWTNAYFTNLGLFSLATAYERARQSARR